MNFKTLGEEERYAQELRIGNEHDGADRWSECTRVKSEGNTGDIRSA